MSFRWQVLLALLVSMSSAHAQQTTELNIYFDGAKLKSTRKQLARLDSLLNTMDRSRIIGITLVGHTDSLFGQASNAALAEKRALSVKELLVERGIAGSLITTPAFNAPVSVVENLVPTGRTRNRRVYMRIEYGPAGPIPPE